MLPASFAPVLSFCGRGVERKNGRIRRVKSALILTLLGFVRRAGNRRLMGHSSYMPLLLSILWVLAFVTATDLESPSSHCRNRGLIQVFRAQCSGLHSLLKQRHSG